MSGNLHSSFDHFILSGQPHPEEARHFGDEAAALLHAHSHLAPLSS